MLQGIRSGGRLGRLTVGVAAGASFTVSAGTVTLVQASLTAGDIVYVGSVGFVATNGAVTLGQATFDMRTSDTACATSLAAQVNAHASLTGVLSATSATGVVTITAKQPGAIGNHITLAKVDTNNAAIVLNGLADTVHQSTLLNGVGGLDASPVTYANNLAA
jgi:phage tail sheath gpL-like